MIVIFFMLLEKQYLVRYRFHYENSCLIEGHKCCLPKRLGLISMTLYVSIILLTIYCNQEECLFGNIDYSYGHLH